MATNNSKVILEVGATTDGFRFRCDHGTSRIYSSIDERTAVLDFVFGKGKWTVADERIGDF